MIGKVPHVVVGRSGHVFINNIEVHGVPYIVERAIVRTAMVRIIQRESLRSVASGHGVRVNPMPKGNLQKNYR